MAITYEHQPSPRIAARKEAGVPKIADQHVGINGRIALIVTAPPSGRCGVPTPSPSSPSSPSPTP